MVFQNLKSPRLATIEFQIDGTHVSYVNTLRRAIMTEVPTVAFRADMNEKGDTTDVVIKKNSTPMTNEMLAHRIGLIPIHADAKTWNPDKYTFSMDIKNDTTEKMLITTAMITVRDEAGVQVPASQFFYPDPITKQHILLASLRPKDGQDVEEISWQARATVGKGKENARFIPCTQASYGYTRDPDPEKQKEYFNKWLWSHKKVTPEGLDDAKRKALEAEFNTMEVARCFIQDERGEPTRFDFTVESVGVMKPESMVLRALEELVVKCQKYAAIPEDVVVQPANAQILGYDFIFRGEDHTLGNLIQTWIVEMMEREGDDTVTYCGYNVPHPLRDEMVIRIGVADGSEVTARGVLTRAAKACAEMFESWKMEWARLMGAAPAAAAATSKKFAGPPGRSKKPMTIT